MFICCLLFKFAIKILQFLLKICPICCLGEWCGGELKFSVCYLVESDNEAHSTFFSVGTSVVLKCLAGETGSIHLSNAKVKNVKHLLCPFCCVQWCKMKQDNVINFVCYKIWKINKEVWAELIIYLCFAYISSATYLMVLLHNFNSVTNFLCGWILCMLLLLGIILKFHIVHVCNC
jgi:hypothetical protein